MVKDLINDFKKFCNQQNWTHEQIAEKLGCSRSYVTRIFSGTRIPSAKILDEMERIMKEYGYEE